MCGTEFPQRFRFRFVVEERRRGIVGKQNDSVETFYFPNTTLIYNNYYATKSQTHKWNKPTVVYGKNNLAMFECYFLSVRVFVENSYFELQTLNFWTMVGLYTHAKAADIACVQAYIFQ